MGPQIKLFITNQLMLITLQTIYTQVQILTD